MERSNRPQRSQNLTLALAKSLTVAHEFAALSSELSDLQALRDAFQRTIEPLGFRYFACCSHVDPLKPQAAVMLLNYPAAWVQTYSQLRFHCIDPVFERASQRAMPFSWDAPEFMWGLTARQRTILEEARTFGIEHGYTIPICAPRSHMPVYASCSLIPDGRLPPWHDLYAVQIMAACLFDRAARVLHLQAPDIFAPPLTEQQLRIFQLVGMSKQDVEAVGHFGFYLRTYAPHIDPHHTAQALARLTEHKGALDLFWPSDSTRAPFFARVAEPLAPRLSIKESSHPQRLSTEEAQREIEHIIQAVLSSTGVDLIELLSTSRHEPVVLARAAIAWHVTQRRLATLTDIAKQLGRYPSSLSVAIRHHRLKHPHMFRLSAITPLTSPESAQLFSNNRTDQIP